MTPEERRAAPDGNHLPGLSALEVVTSLALEPHREGGYFRETYRSATVVHTDFGDRPLSTSIVYLLSEEHPSRFHRLRADELWLYHAGAPLELVLLDPRAARGSTPMGAAAPPAVTSLPIGPELPQAVVPAQTWMAARIIVDDESDWGAGRKPERRWTRDRRSTQEYRWTLVSCVVSPGFDYEDFELGDKDDLLGAFPQAKHAINTLT